MNDVSDRKYDIVWDDSHKCPGSGHQSASVWTDDTDTLLTHGSVLPPLLTDRQVNFLWKYEHHHVADCSLMFSNETIIVVSVIIHEKSIYHVMWNYYFPLVPYQASQYFQLFMNIKSPYLTLLSDNYFSFISSSN